MNRRDFLKTTFSAGMAAATSGILAQDTAFARSYESKENRLKRRKLGRTGDKLSIIGFGGIVVMNMEQSAANNIVHEAIDRGVNYFDVAPTYGNAQERLGPALEGRRDKIFLACKTEKRNKREAAAALDESLRLLKTDHVDLYQLHGLTTMEQLEQCLAQDGALQAFLDGKEQGKLRHIGFSAHSVKTALAAIERFDFDTVLFPVNYILYHNASFGPQVVKRAREKGMGCLCLKAMAYTPWPANATHDYPKCWYQPISDPHHASLALRFTLSEHVTAALPPGEEKLFRIALQAAEQYRPLDSEEREALLQGATGVPPIFNAEA